MGDHGSQLHDASRELEFCDDIIQSLVGIGLNIELCIQVIDESPDRAKVGLDGAISRLGDLIADEFIYGEVSRVSREAPVLILKYDATEVVPGGAGNAANNVAALGARVSLAGLVGDDAEGRRLLTTFPRTVDTRQVVDPFCKAIASTRPIRWSTSTPGPSSSTISSASTSSG